MDSIKLKIIYGKSSINNVRSQKLDDTVVRALNDTSGDTLRSQPFGKWYHRRVGEVICCGIICGCLKQPFYFTLSSAVHS